MLKQSESKSSSASQDLHWFQFSKRHKAYVARITKSGYARPTNRFILALLRAFCRLWVFVQIGRVRVVGAENLSTDEWVLACPNHRSLMDLPIGLSVLKGQYSGLAAADVLAKCGGIAAMFLSRIGIIPVDRSRGGSVMGVSVETFAKRKRFALAGEGKINEHLLGDFKPGAAVIAERTAKLLQQELGGEPRVGIQPIHVKYNRPQGSAAKSFIKIGLKYRDGAVITFLPTQYYDYRNPLTADEWIEAVRDQINTLETVG